MFNECIFSLVNLKLVLFEFFFIDYDRNFKNLMFNLNSFTNLNFKFPKLNETKYTKWIKVQDSPLNKT